MFPKPNPRPQRAGDSAPPPGGGYGGLTMWRRFNAIVAAAVVATAGPATAADPPKPRAVIPLPGPAGAVAFNPDGKKLSTPAADRPCGAGGYELLVWDAEPGKP